MGGAILEIDWYVYALNLCKCFLFVVLRNVIVNLSNSFQEPFDGTEVQLCTTFTENRHVVANVTLSCC